MLLFSIFNYPLSIAEPQLSIIPICVTTAPKRIPATTCLNECPTRSLKCLFFWSLFRTSACNPTSLRTLMASYQTMHAKTKTMAKETDVAPALLFTTIKSEVTNAEWELGIPPDWKSPACQLPVRSPSMVVFSRSDNTMTMSGMRKMYSWRSCMV